MEKFGSISRLVAEIPEEKKRDILEDLRNVFNNQSFIHDDILSREKERTPEHEKMIALADQLTNELLQKYGLPDFQVPVDNVHVIYEKKWWRNTDFTGFYLSQFQAVVVRDNKFKLTFFKMLAHELLHMKSYNAMQLKQGFDDDTKVTSYRSGLETLARDIDDDDHYFKLINEAVIESLAIEIFSQAKTNPIFASDLRNSKNITHSLPAHDIYQNPDTYYVKKERKYPDGEEGNENEFNTHETSSGYGYGEERMSLNILIDKIMDHHSEYKDRQEVFDLFAQAVLQGNMMPLARVIEGTFGRGTFRSLGECTDAKEMIKIVNSLK